jgi:hypothetical protein
LCQWQQNSPARLDLLFWFWFENSHAGHQRYCDYNLELNIQGQDLFRCYVKSTHLHVRTRAMIRKRGFIQRVSIYVVVTIGELILWVFTSIMVYGIRTPRKLRWLHVVEWAAKYLWCQIIIGRTHGLIVGIYNAMIYSGNPNNFSFVRMT